MNLFQRINALVRLGEILHEAIESQDPIFELAFQHNRWFTPANSRRAAHAITDKLLNQKALEVFAAEYPLFQESREQKTIALVFAGNLPLVGFHDWLCVFLCGHRAAIKLSEKDNQLLPYFIGRWAAENPQLAGFVQFVERIQEPDAVIATGSNNSSRYFEYYFGRYPHIIRKNRNGVAVIFGDESDEQIAALGDDVFSYFGLGCRNVSKLYLPQDYDFTRLLAAWEGYGELRMHDKYKNNYDYNRAIWLINNVEHWANDAVIMLEEKSLISRIATLHFEYYNSAKWLMEELQQRNEEMQCVVSERPIEGVRTLPFGTAQQPNLRDYADGVDVVQFLLGL